LIWTFPGRSEGQLLQLGYYIQQRLNLKSVADEAETAAECLHWWCFRAVQEGHEVRHCGFAGVQAAGSAPTAPPFPRASVALEGGGGNIG
jgi:hypothetical protein